MNIQEAQKAVQDSLAPHQANTTLERRALFLNTEVGEVQKELLYFLGVYGASKIEGARQRLAAELADVIWNVLDMANKLDLDMQSELISMLERHKRRTWTI